MNTNNTKVCSSCLVPKLASDFYRRSLSNDGLNASCKECSRKRKTAWHQANPEKAKEQNKEKYRRHSEAIRARVKKYNDSHKEERRAYVKQWYAANYDKVKANCHARRARIKAASGRFTGPEWRALKQAYNYTCLRCGKSEPEIKITPDHVRPLFKGGTNDIDNIQPLCRSCNSWKNAREIDYRNISGTEKDAIEAVLGPVRGIKRLPPTEEVRQRISSTLQGFKHTLETRANMAEGVRRSWERRSARSDSSSQIRGVIWDSESQKWRARVTHHGKRITLGRYPTPEQAALVISKWRETIKSEGMALRT